MAINKEQTMPNGVPITYWRIVGLTIVVNQQTVIEVAGYVSQDKRADEQESIIDPENHPCDVYIETQYIVAEYDPNMSVTKAYEYLKTLPEFSGGEDVIETWATGSSYYVGDLVMYDGSEYQCIQSHVSQEGYDPPNTPALWASHESGEWPEWVQPESTNPYMKGDKVSHNSKHWESAIDYNVYEPGVAGWTEVE